MILVANSGYYVLIVLQGAALRRMAVSRWGSNPAMAVLEDQDTACQYLERAVQIDPGGGYGNLAARALENLATGEIGDVGGQASVSTMTQAAPDGCQDPNFPARG
jgi:hypothetical protein